MQLQKSLGLRDVVLLNVTAVIGLRWISLAAVGGNTSIVLWLAALVFFFLPQAFAVIELTTRLPQEGGIYNWTKTAFGNFHGFMSGWCYWTNNLVYFPSLLVYIAGISVFVAGDGYEAFGENKNYIIAFSIAALWTVTAFNYFGLKLGRWINNIGGIGTWTAGTALILFGIVAVIRFGVANPMPAGSFFADILSFEKLRFFALICFGFTGLELASVLAGEVKNPEKTIPRSVVISGIVIAVIYILGTFSVLVALPASDINIISGFIQGVSAIGNKLGMGWTSNILALLITLGGIGGLMAWFTGAARMPFVAGIDRFLPESFGKIHPKYGSPYKAVLIQAVIASIFIFMSFIGASVEEAYMVLIETTLLVYFIPYVYMFASYIVLRRRRFNSESARTIPKNNNLALIFGVFGLVTTVFAMGMAVVPPSNIPNIFIYELKIFGGVFMFIAVGGLFYWLESWID
ncbi:amino acid permease [candidate division KSB1 bacterium]|nr:amino acid permease [candidate division KSB1 bacterium]